MTSEKEFVSEPIAYFINSQGARFAVYNEEKLADSIAKGYKQINKDEAYIHHTKEARKEEKVC